VSAAWEAPARSAAGHRLIAAAEAKFRETPAAFSLAPADIARRASERAGRPIALPEGLARLADALEAEDRLHALGRQTLGAMIAALAIGGYELKDALAASPGAADRPVARPIFIIGGWRTGTTLLHRLLAHVSGLRAPLYWELSNPLRAGETDPETRAKLVRRAQSMHDFQYALNPMKQRVHDSAAETPEECVVAMGKDGLNWALTAPAWVPGYAQWLRGQDFASAYRLHKQTLQILQGEAAPRWLLKAPAHTGELAPLLRAYPDAVIVHLHRDVLETAASGASLFAVFQATYSDRVDPIATGAYQLETLAFWLRRAEAAKRAPPAGSAPTFIEIAYPDLVADPLAVARDILHRADQHFTAEDEAAMAGYLAENRQHKLGRHRYSPEQFGLTAAMARDAI